MKISYQVEEVCDFIYDVFEKDVETIENKIKGAKFDFNYFTSQEENLMIFNCIHDIYKKYKKDKDKITLLKELLLKNTCYSIYVNLANKAAKTLDLRYTTKNNAFKVYELLKSDKDFTNFLLKNNFIKKNTLIKFKKFEASNLSEIKKILEQMIFKCNDCKLNPFILLIHKKKLESEIKKADISVIKKLTQIESFALLILFPFFKTDIKIKLFNILHDRCFKQSTRQPLTQLKTLMTMRSTYDFFINICRACDNTNIEPDYQFYKKIEKSILRYPNKIFSLAPYLMVLASASIEIKIPESIVKYKNVLKCSIWDIYKDACKYFHADKITDLVDFLEISNNDNDQTKIFKKIILNI